MGLIEAIGLGLAMVLVIEGLGYALFPDGAKQMMAMILETPSETLRKLGIGALALGVLGVWLMVA